jgi:FkbM family methyltransferase
MLKQFTRTLNMFRNLRNPSAYLGCKFGLVKRDPLFLKLRNGVSAEVPAQLLHAFKESVFAEDYVRGFPARVIGDFENATVLDVGANAGFFSLWWLSRHPGSKVICVEPIPENFALLKRNADLNAGEKITLVNGAVGGQAGQIVLRYTLTKGFTTSATVLRDVGGQVEISVKAFPLAQLLADFDLKQIDFLKLDCEGGEYDFLYHCDDDALNTIRRIAVETHSGPEPGQNKDALCDFLRSKNFHVNAPNGSAMVYAWRQ